MLHILDDKRPFLFCFFAICVFIQNCAAISVVFIYCYSQISCVSQIVWLVLQGPVFDVLLTKFELLEMPLFSFSVQSWWLLSLIIASHNLLFVPDNQSNKSEGVSLVIKILKLLYQNCIFSMQLCTITGWREEIHQCLCWRSQWRNSRNQWVGQSHEAWGRGRWPAQLSKPDGGQRSAEYPLPADWALHRAQLTPQDPICCQPGWVHAVSLSQ